LTALVVGAARGIHQSAPSASIHHANPDPDASFYGAQENRRLQRPLARPTQAAPTTRERVRTQPTQLARYRFRGHRAQEGTAVEPDSFASGSAIFASRLPAS
jgi:hypothetical protein